MQCLNFWLCYRSLRSNHFMCTIHSGRTFWEWCSIPKCTFLYTIAWEIILANINHQPIANLCTRKENFLKLFPFFFTSFLSLLFLSLLFLFVSFRSPSSHSLYAVKRMNCLFWHDTQTLRSLIHCVFINTTRVHFSGEGFFFSTAWIRLIWLCARQ